MSRAIAAFRRTRTITQDDCDQLGHVNNLVWLRFALELAEAHSAAAGFDGAATLAEGGVWVVQRHEIHYRRDAHPGDAIEECTWVSEMRGARSIRHARFRDAADTTLVESITDWAFIDPVASRPRRIPKAILEAFTPVPTPEDA